MKTVKNKKGFTLIELLVVILIIGILAAVALPQYRKAVAKAQLAQVVIAIKSIKNAEKIYYLANNNYTNDMDNLDISIDSTVKCRIEGSAAICYNEKFALWKGIGSNFLECAMKTQDENSHLVDACKEIANTNNCFLSSGSSTCIYYLKLKPCLVCQGRNSM